MANIAWGKIEQGQQALVPFWEKLILNSHSLIFLDKHKIKNFHKLPCAWMFRLDTTKKISYYFLIALLPLWWAINILLLFIHRYRFQLDTIVLCNWEDKLLLSRPAKILGLKTIWLFMPADNTETSVKKLTKQSKNIEIICFSPTCLADLERAGFTVEQTHLLPLGVPGKGLKLQGTIFSELAEQDKRNSLKKFFSIVTV